MNAPASGLLTVLLTFIAGTLAGAAARPLGTPAMIVFGLLGTLIGYVAARWILGRIF